MEEVRRLMRAGAELRFLERLQLLLFDEGGGRFSSTYKFAVLLGLAELCVEAPPGTDSFTTRQLAERVVELYWPQVRTLDPQGAVVRQGADPRLVIPARV